MPAGAIRWSLGAEVRYAGQGNAVDVSIPYRAIGPKTLPAIRKAFEERYQVLYGSLVPSARPEVVTWRLTGQSRTRSRHFKLAAVAGKGRPEPVAKRRMYVSDRGRYGKVPVYERYALPAGTKLDAPLVLSERESTIVVARKAKVEIMENLTVSVTLP